MFLCLVSDPCVFFYYDDDFDDYYCYHNFGLLKKCGIILMLSGPGPRQQRHCPQVPCCKGHIWDENFFCLCSTQLLRYRTQLKLLCSGTTISPLLLNSALASFHPISALLNLLQSHTCNLPQNFKRDFTHSVATVLTLSCRQTGCSQTGSFYSPIGGGTRELLGLYSLVVRKNLCCDGPMFINSAASLSLIPAKHLSCHLEPSPLTIFPNPPPLVAPSSYHNSSFSISFYPFLFPFE